MTFTSVLLTILWLIVIPVVVGSLFSFRAKGFVADGVEKENNGRKQMGIFIWSWFLGQLLLWCVFQIIAVGAILSHGNFTTIVKLFSICAGGFCLAAVAVNAVRAITGKMINFTEKSGTTDDSRISNNSGTSDKDTALDNAEICGQKKCDRVVMAAWIIFAVILVIQVVLQVVLAYMDADDAYYVSEAVAIESSNNMYVLVPYTGVTTEMDYRHSLEPFPAWLAYISRMTKTQVVSMAHVLLPAILLPLTYGFYAVIGNRILGKNRQKLPIYLVVTELLVLFSLYSTKVPEKFFITRIRQGKSTIASLIIPGIVLCLFLILDYAKEKKRTDVAVWIMLFMLSTAGCLCSTLGALLCVIPVAIVAIMMIFAYKKGWHLIPMIIGCIPCFVYALLYVINR